MAKKKKRVNMGDEYHNKGAVGDARGLMSTGKCIFGGGEAVNNPAGDRAHAHIHTSACALEHSHKQTNKELSQEHSQVL